MLCNVFLTLSTVFSITIHAYLLSLTQQYLADQNVLFHFLTNLIFYCKLVTNISLHYASKLYKATSNHFNATGYSISSKSAIIALLFDDTRPDSICTGDAKKYTKKNLVFQREHLMGVEFHQKASILHVTASSEGQRIDNFLFKTLKNVPKSRIYRMLRTGEVRINKKRAKASDKLQLDDQVRLPPLYQNSTEKVILPQSLKDRVLQTILYEDEDLMILNKPPGLPVHGGTESSFGVIDVLRQAFPENAFLELVHRLDKQTSGCLMIAKKRDTLKALHLLLQEGSCQKTYFALVHGRWPKNEHTIDAPLEKRTLASGERKVRVHPEGKAALTRVNIEKCYANHSLLRLTPKTGRTHQLRVHLSYKGHPIVGDTKYGQRQLDHNSAATEKCRLFLHAYRLAFIHPKTQQKLNVEAPLWEDLVAVLEEMN